MGVEFISFPIRDKTVPDAVGPVAAVARDLADRVAGGQAVAIHCRAGIGRSTTLAACVLILLGVDGDIALDMIAAARGLEVRKPKRSANGCWRSPRRRPFARPDRLPARTGNQCFSDPAWRRAGAWGGSAAIKLRALVFNCTNVPDISAGATSFLSCWRKVSRCSSTSA